MHDDNCFLFLELGSNGDVYYGLVEVAVVVFSSVDVIAAAIVVVVSDSISDSGSWALLTG